MTGHVCHVMSQVRGHLGFLIELQKPARLKLHTLLCDYQLIMLLMTHTVTPCMSLCRSSSSFIKDISTHRLTYLEFRWSNHERLLGRANQSAERPKSR